MVSSLEQMNRYVSPINPSLYPGMTMVLLLIGVFLMSWFIVYEVTTSKLNRQVVKEIALSSIASVFMGLGVFFLLLWVGIYV